MSIEAMKRIKSLLQDGDKIDSHTISAVVAECDMAILAQQPDNAACGSVQKRLAAQQPATRLPEDVVIGHVTLCKGSNISLLIDHAKRLNADVERLEAQQPSSKEHLFELWWEAHMPNATQEQAWTAFTAAVASNGVGIAAQQPATPEPMQADSSGHLRVIASLGAALRRLSFAAQTTGGTDGPDAELQSAIGQAEQALSLGGIWQAMSATPEPVAWLDEMLADTREVFDAGGSETPQVVRDVIEYVKSWVTVYSEKNHPAPTAHPAPSVSGDLVRDAISTVREHYRGTDWGKAAESICDAIDAVLAAKEKT